jgi:hypothetical protein
MRFDDSKEINTHLKRLRDAIRALSPGKTRDTMQARFDLVITRLEQLPERIMAQWPFADVAEMEMVRHTELLWALDAWDIEP